MVRVPPLLPFSIFLLSAYHSVPESSRVNGESVVVVPLGATSTVVNLAPNSVDPGLAAPLL